MGGISGRERRRRSGDRCDSWVARGMDGRKEVRKEEREETEREIRDHYL